MEFLFLPDKLHALKRALSGGVNSAYALHRALSRYEMTSASQKLLGGGLVSSSAWSWLYVERRFRVFLSNIQLTDDQLADGKTKIKNIIKCLNKHYRGIDSDSEYHMLGGSWGKLTHVRPPRDIDLIYFLPVEIYTRYAERTGNIQSQLLQEVKDVLASTFSQTAMRADGQVVMVGFNSYMVEVVPAFRLQNGQAWICDSNQSGRYKTIDPVAEIRRFDVADKKCNSNSRDLVRMLKTWQAFCNVPIPSFILECLVLEFLGHWPYAGRSPFYYDWIVLDFLRYMLTRVNGHIIMPGSGEVMLVGNEWESRARSAIKAAEEACEYERQNYDYLAAEKWQKIFGYKIWGVS